MKRKLPFGSGPRRLLGPLAALLGLALPLAEAATIPTNTSVYFQTSGRERAPTIGDWYTSKTSGNSDTNRFHRFDITITQDQLDLAGGSVTLTVNDAESTAGGTPNDEVTVPSDPTRFTLRSEGATMPDSGGSLLKQQTYPSGSANGQTFTYAFTTPGKYVLFSETGAYPISKDATATLNDDDNSFTFTLGTADFSPVLGEYQSTIQASSTTSFDAYFYVAPGTAGPLYLRNFDLDNGGTVTYYRPDGTSVSGTASNNGVWNGGGSLNAGGDSVATDGVSGWWRIAVTGWTADNQTFFQANDGINGNRLPLVYVSPVNLDLTKTVSNAAPLEGDNVTYTVTLTNPAGGVGATGIRVSDLLPSGLTYVSSTVAVPANSTGSYDKTTGVWKVRNLSAGATATLSIQATVVNRGSVTNTATLTSVDQPFTPKSAKVPLTATNRPPVAKDDTATTPANTPVSVNVVSNDTGYSPGTVNAATVDLDPSTSGIQTTRTVAGQGTYTVNASGVVTFTPVSGFTGTTAIPYTVQDNDGLTSNPATLTVTVIPAADLSVTKTGPAYAKPGTDMTYTITVKNNSTATAASNVTVTDTLPAPVTYKNSTPAAAVSGGQVLTWTLTSLAANTTQTYTVTVTAPSATTLETAPAARSLTNNVKVSSTNDPDSTNNAASATTDMVSSRLVKQVRNVTADDRDNKGTARFASSAAGRPTEVLEYCITFNNFGGADLPNYAVSDGVPSNTTYVTGSAAVTPAGTATFDSAATTWNDGTANRTVNGVVTAKVGRLAAGAQGQLCFRATIR
ncbi:hypothetical protein DEIPH_ctg055orf0018 [Deinococcus phoenicis]|uniref:DUF11 domain-containing protein n=1 Tax=Deinococcus phoenicis TaxID=1476583 RepID=A0A016QLQ3_9DEIO|nr:isopeptide-forming domain-containing fimbrial protein [Deinococcus phoenicis]EYB66988.1 hypothetical protein DEIPH_ctg055orf0018 [Deinococcus phoenicis]